MLHWGVFWCVVVHQCLSWHYTYYHFQLNCSVHQKCTVKNHKRYLICHFSTSSMKKGCGDISLIQIQVKCVLKNKDQQNFSPLNCNCVSQKNQSFLTTIVSNANSCSSLKMTNATYIFWYVLKYWNKAPKVPNARENTTFKDDFYMWIRSACPDKLKNEIKCVKCWIVSNWSFIIAHTCSLFEKWS